MSVTPAEILDIANSLAIAGDEVSQRTAINRAYYAAYHASQNWHAKLPLPGVMGTKGGMHDKFIHQLRHPDPSCSAEQKVKSKALAQRLVSIRAQRNEADYKITGNSVNDLMAATACATCHEICTQTA